MICKNHERQPSFLGVAVEKLVKKFRKQRTNSEGQALPLKSVLFFLLHANLLHHHLTKQI